MIRHYLREFRALCEYDVIGVGENPGSLTGLIFDAVDWHVCSFVVRHDTAFPVPVLLETSTFSAIDDDARELRLDVDTEDPATISVFDPDGLADSSLFDAAALIGAEIDAVDGPAGRIDDLLVNVKIWQMRYFIISTDDKRILTDIEWASSLASGTRQPSVDLPRMAISTAPVYERLEELRSGHEEALYRHYTGSVHAAARRTG